MTARTISWKRIQKHVMQIGALVATKVGPYLTVQAVDSGATHGSSLSFFALPPRPTFPRFCRPLPGSTAFLQTLERFE